MPDRATGQHVRTLYLVRRLQITAYLEMERALKPFGVTPTQYMVMSSLAVRGRSSSAQLSRRFSVRPQSMIKLILGLESVGLVSRVTREEDRRVLEISLSPNGSATLQKCDEVVDELERAMLSPLSSAQHGQLRDLIGEILKRFDRDERPVDAALDKPV
jgi:DNA-binding MarR family transcriptional regulator